MKIRWKGPFLAFVLACGAVVSAPGLDGAAHAVDVGRACTLTVRPGSGDYAEDLAQADVAVDLYKVADAVVDSSYDTYDYRFTEGYAGLSLPEDPDSAAWDALAQKAAQKALAGGTPVASGKAGSAVRLPGCGLYLAVARGEGITDYTTTVEGSDGAEEIATIAHSGRYTYTFTPSLVSLPGKEADANGDINTAGDGDWLYHLTVTLKPERSVRYGSLQIVKDLRRYETSGPAAFVFNVEASLDGENVYSDVVSLTFTEPGQRATLVEKIPVGAVVTVTEVYSGAAYSPVSAQAQEAQIVPDTPVPVTFANDYNGSDRGGGAIVNHFSYSADGGWGWEQMADNG